MTKVVWASAKAQAEKAAALATAGGAPEARPAPAASASPLAKRRRTGTGLGDSQDQSVIFPMFGPSQPSLTPLEEDPPVAARVQAHAALDYLLGQLGGYESVVAPDVLGSMRTMELAAMSYWREVSLDLSKAAASLNRFLDHQRRLYWRSPPWRGVNLGGWLLLEPGPSASIFEQCGPARCEWDLMVQMRKKLGAERSENALQVHRETFVTEDDFRDIRAFGLNAVRIPFGYWVVTGPVEGEVFVGPCMEYLDRALSWCKAHGLQALLDLHGAPGGESGEAPCGRERRDWRWEDWGLDGSLEALRVVARRYRGHPSVTGISVCNEPSETVPAEVLCQFYDRAVQAIRGAGMPPDEVAIVLPVYRTERLDEIWRIWNRKFDGFVEHPNVAFDLHLYHCFGPWWQRQGIGSHMRMTKRHRKILRRIPAVVGEWSLALGPRALDGDQYEEDQAMCAFAAAQLDAYSQASHGWFFWNWRDGPSQHPGWDVRRCIENRWLSRAQLVEAAAASRVRG